MPFGSTAPPYSAMFPHRGTDFAYLPDDVVYAPMSGTVNVKPLNGDDGNAIYMARDDVFLGMLHLSRFLVSQNDVVKEGQPIGIMGETGRAQGRHLHWAAKVSGIYVDPLSLVTSKLNAREGVYMTTKNLVSNYFYYLLGRPADDAAYKTFVGQPPDVVFDAIVNSQEYKDKRNSEGSQAMEKLAQVTYFVNKAKEVIG